MLYSAFAVCPSGLEEILLAELQNQPGISEASAGRGGVWFRAEASAIARANLWCRIPTRILLAVEQFRLRRAEDLLEAAGRVPWELYFGPDQTFRVDVNQARRPLFDLAPNFAVLKIKDGVCDRFRERTGRRPSIETQIPDQRLWLFIDGEKATLSMDTSGEPLFKRGWRMAKGQAPLRENLAAALVAVADWQPDTPLLDPFCGSGTLLLEALQRAAGLAPGYHPSRPRSFSCEHWGPGSAFGRVNWQALRDDCQAAWQAADNWALGATMQVTGRDTDEQVLKAAQANAARALPARLAEKIVWQQADFLGSAAPQNAGLIITNPPYGERLEVLGLQDDRQFSAVLKQGYAGWTAWILAHDLRFDSAIRLKASRRMPVFNGDLECRWMRFDMVSGGFAR
jgi:putative N6-adenine-specific DNA methylase